MGINLLVTAQAGKIVRHLRLLLQIVKGDCISNMQGRIIEIIRTHQTNTFAVVQRLCGDSAMEPLLLFAVQAGNRVDLVSQNYQAVSSKTDSGKTISTMSPGLSLRL